MTKLPSVNVMDCATTRKWIQRQLDGDSLPPKLKEKFNAHLKSCKLCNLFAKQLSETVEMVQTIPYPAPSLGFQARLMRSLGLAPLPVWLRWFTGFALGFVSLWIISLITLGESLSFGLFKQLGWITRFFKFSKELFGFAQGLDALTILLPVGIIFTLVFLGILSSRMMHKSHHATPRSI